MPVYENVTIVIKGNVEMNVYPEGDGEPPPLPEDTWELADGSGDWELADGSGEWDLAVS